MTVTVKTSTMTPSALALENTPLPGRPSWRRWLWAIAVIALLCYVPVLLTDRTIFGVRLSRRHRRRRHLFGHRDPFAHQKDGGGGETEQTDQR